MFTRLDWLSGITWDGLTTTTTVKTTKAAPDEIEAPRQVLNHNLIFLAVGQGQGRLLGLDPDRGPPVSDVCTTVYPSSGG